MADRQPDAQAAADEWLATVRDRAHTRIRAEAVVEGTEFSADDLELVEIGILAGASEMLSLVQELALRRSD
jgi:hypothetical protein